MMPNPYPAPRPRNIVPPRRPVPPRNQRPPERPLYFWLTIDDCAEMVKVSKMTIYRLIHNGELPATRIGRSLRVREDHFAKYLADGFAAVVDDPTEYH